MKAVAVYIILSVNLTVKNGETSRLATLHKRQPTLLSTAQHYFVETE
jgi:hypothetical protein